MEEEEKKVKKIVPFNVSTALETSITGRKKNRKERESEEFAN